MLPISQKDVFKFSHIFIHSLMNSKRGLLMKVYAPSYPKVNLEGFSFTEHWSLSHKARDMLKSNKHHRHEMAAPQAHLILTKLWKINTTIWKIYWFHNKAYARFNTLFLINVR